MENKELTGYPSIDKPWLKYYSEDAIRSALPKYSLYEYLWESNKEHLSDIALIWNNKTISYNELFDNIDRVAKALHAIGVKENDVITLVLLNSPETVYLFYAISKIGATSNFINVLSTKEEIQQIMEECDSEFVFSHDIFSDKLEILNKEIIVVLIELFQTGGIFQRGIYRFKLKRVSTNQAIRWDYFLKKQKDIKAAQYSEEHIAIIGHTGGTTGKQKNVVLSDISLNGLAQEYYHCLNHKRQEIFLNMVIPFVVYGVCVNLHMPLILGMKVVLIPRINPNKADKLFIKYRPNHIISVPSLISSLLNSSHIKHSDMSHLITAGAGGDGMTIELEDKLNLLFGSRGSNAKILNGYGMSEVSATACTNQYEARKRGSVGIPLSHNIISVFNIDTREELKYGEEGEICILSPYCMKEYLHDKNSTDELIVTHPDGNKWVHTGDIGFVDEDGFVFIKGRIKRIFIVRSNGIASKVFPDQIEKVASESRYVRECCAVPVPDKTMVNKIRLWVIPSEKGTNMKELEKDIFDRCKKELPEQYIPNEYNYIETLPLTSVGKVDYRKLEEMAASDSKID